MTENIVELDRNILLSMPCLDSRWTCCKLGLYPASVQILH
jgi:hypothetical protein